MVVVELGTAITKYTVWHKCLTGKALMNLTNQSCIIKIFPVNICTWKTRI